MGKLVKLRMIENPDLTNLKATCQSVLDEYDPDRNEDEINSVFEAAMMAFFGEDIFKHLE